MGESEKIISQYRAEVIEKSINIENIISGIISQHYLKRVDMHFLLEVLYDELFSFGLKVRILKKICNLDGTQEKYLGRLNTIRNVFAHCGLFLVDLKDPQRRTRVPNPKNTDEDIDFAKLYEEFLGLEKEIVEKLAEILKEKGGELNLTPD